MVQKIVWATVLLQRLHAAVISIHGFVSLWRWRKQSQNMWKYQSVNKFKKIIILSTYLLLVVYCAIHYTNHVRIYFDNIFLVIVLFTRYK